MFRIGDIVSPPSKFNIKSYGAIGDGTTDDTSAIVSAISACSSAGGSEVLFPQGTYKTSSIIVIPNNVLLVGVGPGSIIKPTNAVTITAVQLNGNYCGMKSLLVDGNNTSGATGILVGESTISLPSLSEVVVQNFRGSGAYGLRLKNSINASIRNCIFLSNQTGMYAYGTSLPTVTDILGCLFQSSVEYGVRLDTAWSMNFKTCTFEGCGKNGLWLNDAYALCVDIHVDNCWFEGNCTSSGVYHILAGAARFTIRDAFFEDGYALHVTGGSRFMFENLQINNHVTGGVLIDASPAGFIDAMGIDYILNSVFTINSANVIITPGPYGTVAPTTGTWRLGDTVRNSSPAAGDNMGWVCVSAGTPGTWKPFGPIGL